MASTVTETKYSPPTMVNPVVIDLSKTGGQNWWSFPPDQDVIFIGDPNNVRTQKIQTEGGHNIMVLGGHYENNTGSTGTMAFYGVSGEVYVDGAHIDNKNSHGSDGIDIAGGANTSLTVQNTIIENVTGSNSGGHADGIQTHGNVGGEIRIHNVSISTNYQGIFISPQYADNPSKVTLSNVDLKYTGPAEDGSDITYLLWTNDDPNAQEHVPWVFDNVYVEPRAGQDPGRFTVWPTTNGGAVVNGNQISWPSLGYQGFVTVGSHAPFIDEGKIGFNFASDASILMGGNGTVPPPTEPPPGEEPPPVDTDAPPALPADVHESGAPTNWISSSNAGRAVYGTSGNDQIAGVEGQTDTGGMRGRGGDDTYIVDQAGDRVIEGSNAGNDSVLSYSTEYTLSSNVENLTLGGTGDNSGTGNALNNIIRGNDGANQLNGMDGNDYIDGGAGDDVINGGAGNDVLYGGAGNDKYVVSEGNDVIHGFSDGDTVDLGSLYTQWSDVQQNLSQTSKGDTILALTGGGSLTFDNVQMTQLEAKDFGLTDTTPPPEEPPPTEPPPVPDTPTPGKLAELLGFLDNLFKELAHDNPSLQPLYDTLHQQLVDDHWVSM